MNYDLSPAAVLCIQEKRKKTESRSNAPAAEVPAAPGAACMVSVPAETGCAVEKKRYKKTQLAPLSIPCSSRIQKYFARGMGKGVLRKKEKTCRAMQLPANPSPKAASMGEILWAAQTAVPAVTSCKKQSSASAASGGIPKRDNAAAVTESTPALRSTESREEKITT